MDEEKKLEQESTQGEATGTTPEAKGAEAEEKLPQNVEEAFKRRLERERRRLQEQLQKQYADYDELKKAAAELAKVKEAQLSEQERLAKQLEELKSQLAQAQQQQAQLEQERIEALIRAAVVNEATKLGFHDPLDAYRMVDLSALTVEEDGRISGVGEQLKALAEGKPYLLRKEQLSKIPATNLPRGGAQTESDEERRKRLFGLGGTPIGKAQGGGLFKPNKS